QGMDEIVGGTVFLTGGCSRLRGLPKLASSIFGMKARRAIPQGFDGLIDHLAVPEMATVVGLIKCGHTKSPT
ncbi:MAG: cell division protein FtsA, partial [Lentisphaerota bacterium]